MNKETKKVELIGLPLLRPLQDVGEDGLSASLKATINPEDKNFTFLQIDPTRYLFSQRNVASKMDLPPGGSEDIQVFFPFVFLVLFLPIETFASRPNLSLHMG